MADLASAQPRKKLYIETVGCQMNVLDSELVAARLRSQGYELTTDIEAADTILYNTCSVRQHAEDKIYSALGRIKHLKRRKPELEIGVLGCMAQKDQEQILKRAPHVDIVVGPGQLARVPELLDRARTLGLEGLIGSSGSKYEAGRRTGAWIKIKLHLEQEFVIGGYTEPEGSRKFFGALLVGFYEGKQLKFCGRVGTGFTDKLLRSLFSKLEEIRVESCLFVNVPAKGRSRWDQGLTAAEMKRCHWVNR